MPQINVDLSKTTAVKCDSKSLLSNCSCEIFEQVYFIRKLPALLSPTGQTEYIPMQAFRCIQCKTIKDLSDKTNDLKII